MGVGRGFIDSVQKEDGRWAFFSPPHNTNCNWVLLTDLTKLLTLITLAQAGNNRTNTVGNYTDCG